jgi:hypothetical protein
MCLVGKVQNGHVVGLEAKSYQTEEGEGIVDNIFAEGVHSEMSLLCENLKSNNLEMF